MTSAIRKNVCRMASAVGRSVRFGCLQIDRVFHDVTSLFSLLRKDLCCPSNNNNNNNNNNNAVRFHVSTTRRGYDQWQAPLEPVQRSSSPSRRRRRRRRRLRLIRVVVEVRPNAHHPPQGAAGRDQDSTSRIRVESLPSRRRQTAAVAGSRCTVRPTKAPLGGRREYLVKQVPAGADMVKDGRQRQAPDSHCRRGAARLVDACPDSLLATDGCGSTPLQRAVPFASQEVGATAPRSELPAGLAREGRAWSDPCARVCGGGWDSASKHILSGRHEADKNGVLLRRAAAEGASVDVIRLLVERRLSAKTKYGRCPADNAGCGRGWRKGAPYGIGSSRRRSRHPSVGPQRRGRRRKLSSARLQ
jgi:hypothetical protein